MKAFDLAIRRILEGPRGPAIGAFFDFDGTLIDGYSAAAYIIDRIQRRDMKLRELIDTIRLARRKDFSDAEFAEIISKGLQQWAGRTEEQMRALWQRLWLKKVALTLFPEAWKLCQAHREMGHTIVIASSATPYQIEPLAREFGIDHILATQPMVRKGKLTGALMGKPLWGDGKADAVRKFARSRRLRLNRSFGYANGNEDIAFLESVGQPTAVQPRKRLEQVATERSWPILRFPSRRIPPRPAIARTVGAYGAMGATFLLGLGYSKASGNTRRAVDLVTSFASDAALAVLGVKVDVHGERHLWAHRPCVFIINHQSKFDLFLMMHLIRSNFTGVAKQQVAKVFGVGKLMHMADMAFIDPKHAGKAIDALKPAVERLKRGLSMVMAPEATRSWTPRIGVFEKSAFQIAKQAGVHIVPVVIRNAGEIMGRNDHVMRAGTVQVAVLPAIDVSSWPPAEFDARVAAVRQLYADTLANWPGAKRA